MRPFEDWSKVFTLDTDTGNLTWLIGKRKGRIAGYTNVTGYRCLMHNEVSYLQHRIVWAIVHGRWPNQIDHINMNRADNRPENLREASIADNNRNRTLQSNNTSGFKGVTFHKGTNRFQAKIMVNKVRKSLGYFKTPEEASSAYNLAAKEHHGDFARF